MPARPLLTFDLDGVLCRPPFGINPGRGRHKTRTVEGTNNLLWRTERWRYLFRRPMPGAVEGLRELRGSFECHVLSARGERARALTERWLARHFGFEPAVHLRPHWRETSAGFKVRMVQELRPLAHFEDDPHTASWVAELVPAVFLVDWWRNRWLEGDRVYRVTRLVDAIPALRAFAPGAESGAGASRIEAAER
jgi:hypothetical protein